MVLPILSFFCLFTFYSENFDPNQAELENQNDRVTQVQKAPKSIEEIDNLNNHAFSLKGNYPDSLYIYANITLEASQKIGYQKGIAHSYTNFGVYHYQKSNHGQSVENYLKAKDIFTKEKLFNKSASTSNNIGLVYFRERDFEKALAYHQEAIDMADENESLSNIANYKLNKAMVLANLKSFEEALPTYYEAIRDLEKSGESAYISNAYLNLGNQFGANGKIDSVKKYFDKGLIAAIESSEFEALAYAYTSQIKYYVVTENPKEALKFAEKSLTNALKSGSVFNISDAYHTVAALQEDTGDIKGALSSLRNHYTYKDSLRRKEQTLEIARIEATKKIESEKAIFDLELQNKEQSNKQKALIIGQLIFLICAIVILFILVAKNLSKSKVRNQLLHQKNKEIATLAKNLKSLNNHQNQIFGVIGHDLKGPVNSLITVTELLTEKQLNIEELSEIMPHLNNEIRRAGVTLENLLHWALSQKEGESIQHEWFQLKSLFLEVVDSLLYAIDHKKLKINLDIDDEIMLYADKQMVEISFRNLIANAIKFTNEEGSISCIARTENDIVKISIEDNGVGIDPETLEKLNKNELVSNFGTDNEKGTGLGLALCKGYVEKNNGSLVIESEVGKGTKIKVSFEYKEV
ncbi:tetratricopeptide repeat-containing sensor histidine kinase [Belliella sp. R4-6]|uniref:histidine kinase n=1 Tax=Belliella alkalica TaxID=1730871 RepID=A0ABS9V7L2_9BACT|nr:tetratricopeptide repeat-containing sensor histidine kinase [Belliella alkalica]MCH7412409.1 tetratricopeptide repeat-containing sensor histidine kinase [Belliella alkalica]